MQVLPRQTDDSQTLPRQPDRMHPLARQTLSAQPDATQTLMGLALAGVSTGSDRTSPPATRRLPGGWSMLRTPTSRRRLKSGEKPSVGDAGMSRGAKAWAR
jgi:hypothetical protein